MFDRISPTQLLGNSGSHERPFRTRIGGYNFGCSTIARTDEPPPVNDDSICGDRAFNTGQVVNVESTYDLLAVAKHEFGLNILGSAPEGDTVTVYQTGVALGTATPNPSEYTSDTTPTIFGQSVPLRIVTLYDSNPNQRGGQSQLVGTSIIQSGPGGVTTISSPPPTGITTAGCRVTIVDADIVLGTAVADFRRNCSFTCLPRDKGWHPDRRRADEFVGIHQQSLVDPDVSGVTPLGAPEGFSRGRPSSEAPRSQVSSRTRS